jgi:hypothetical protein
MHVDGTPSVVGSQQCSPTAQERFLPPSPTALNGQ